MQDSDLRCLAAALIVSCGGSSSETSNDASELANSSEIGELVIDEDAAGAPSGDGTLSIPSTSESLDVSSDLDSEEEDTATADELTDEERALLFAECMRDEGIENWPDPATNPDGSVDLSGGGAVGQDHLAPLLSSLMRSEPQFRSAGRSLRAQVSSQIMGRELALRPKTNL